MREPLRLSLIGTCFLVLIRMELARLRDQIIALWMYPSGADAGLEGIVNQKQHQPSRPSGPAAPIQNGSESASTYSVEQQALQPPSLQFVSLQQDKDNSNIAAEVVPFYSGMDLN